MTAQEAAVRAEDLDDLGVAPAWLAVVAFILEGASARADHPEPASMIGYDEVERRLGSRHFVAVPAPLRIEPADRVD